MYRLPYLTQPNIQKTLIAAALLTLGGNASSWAKEGETTPIFTLGAITVTGSKLPHSDLTEDQVASTVTRKDMQKFNRENIADALNLLSGVTLSHGQKNERRISIRGFETNKLGLFIDGIPVYIPFDGAVDMNRFTTADLAAIQVAKGFTSAAYGPNTMAGAVNLITRKPSDKLEGDVMLGFGAGREQQVRANIGSNQGSWYVQGGISYLKSDSFRLSSDFVANKFEDGGQRNNAHRKDQKLSFKLGLTPNARDEYAISYMKQEGEKGQPTSTIAAGQFWKWPYWNKESLYLTTRTALGNTETLKIKLYHDTFDNAIDMYTNATFTTRIGTGPSIYKDKTDGGSVELETTRFDQQTLRFFAFYKKDLHDKDDAAGATRKFDKMEDTLISYAIEDNIQLSPQWLLSMGASHHELKPKQIYKSDAIPALSLPGKKTATDSQAGLFYDWTANARLYATLSQKTRLPSLSDRYNSAFGRYVENPNLQPEKSINYEIGYQGAPWQDSKGEIALFRSDVTDKIQTWLPNPNLPCTAGTNVCQIRNIGKVRYAGLELGLRSQLSSQLELGGNYTYTSLKNISDSSKLTDVPKEKLTLHATYRPSANIDLIAFIENNSDRWASNTVELGSHATLNLKTAYRPMKDIALEVGINNATDKNYSLANGYPQAGRMWFANVNYRF